MDDKIVAAKCLLAKFVNDPRYNALFRQEIEYIFTIYRLSTVGYASSLALG